MPRQASTNAVQSAVRPRFTDHAVKSAIKLERQSTTVPNTSNTSAFTAEISDMPVPRSRRCSRLKHLAVLDEAEIVGNLVVDRARLRIVGLRQPIDPARIRRRGLRVDLLDQ